MVEKQLLKKLRFAFENGDTSFKGKTYYQVEYKEVDIKNGRVVS